MAAAGLKELMNNQRVASKVILIDDVSMNDIYSGEEDVIDASGLCIFYIPKESFYFLLMLKYISEKIKTLHPDIYLVFASDVSCSWLYQKIWWW